MNKLERLKVKIEAIEEEPTPKQVLGVVEDLVHLLEEQNKGTMGFKDEKEK